MPKVPRRLGLNPAFIPCETTRRTAGPGVSDITNSVTAKTSKSFKDISLNYRTGSGSDLAASPPFNLNARAVALLTQNTGIASLNYRTGSGSDLAVSAPFNQNARAVALLTRLDIHSAKTPLQFV